MINEAPLAKFEPLAEGLVKPLYADYSFGNIPDTVEFLLTANRRGPLLPADCFGGSYPEPREGRGRARRLVRLAALAAAPPPLPAPPPASSRTAR